MKELETNINNKIEVSVKKQQEKKHEFIGDIVQYEGHKLWEINKETLEIKEAKFSYATYRLFQKNKKEIFVKDGFAYVSALNKKNALKKYNNNQNGGKIMGNQKLPY